MEENNTVTLTTNFNYYNLSLLYPKLVFEIC